MLLERGLEDMLVDCELAMITEYLTGDCFSSMSE